MDAQINTDIDGNNWLVVAAAARSSASNSPARQQQREDVSPHLLDQPSAATMTSPPTSAAIDDSFLFFTNDEDDVVLAAALKIVEERRQQRTAKGLSPFPSTSASSSAQKYIVGVGIITTQQQHQSITNADGSVIQKKSREDTDGVSAPEKEEGEGFLATTSSLNLKRAMHKQYIQTVRDELNSIIKYRGEIFDDRIFEQIVLCQKEEKKTRRRVEEIGEMEARQHLMRYERMHEEEVCFNAIKKQKKAETLVPWCTGECSYCCMSRPNWENHIKKVNGFNAAVMCDAEDRSRKALCDAEEAHFYAITCSKGNTEQKALLLEGQSEALRAEEFCFRGEIEVMWLKGYYALYAIHAVKKSEWDSKAYANDLRNKQIEVHREHERLHIVQVRATRQMTIMCSADEASRRDAIEQLENVKFQDILNKFSYRYTELKADEWRKEVKTALLERDALLQFRDDTIRERAEALEEQQKKAKFELEREFRELRKLRKAGAQLDVLPPCHRCQQIPAKDITSHRLNECPERPTQCMKCEVILPVSAVEAHKEVCPSRILQCPHCANYFKAAYMEQVHTESRCAAVKDAVLRLERSQPTLRINVISNVKALNDLNEFYENAESLYVGGGGGDGYGGGSSFGPHQHVISSSLPSSPVAGHPNNNSTNNNRDSSTINITDVSITIEKDGGGKDGKEDDGLVSTPRGGGGDVGGGDGGGAASAESKGKAKTLSPSPKTKDNSSGKDGSTSARRHPTAIVIEEPSSPDFTMTTGGFGSPSTANGTSSSASAKRGGGGVNNGSASSPLLMRNRGGSVSNNAKPANNASPTATTTTFPVPSANGGGGGKGVDTISAGLAIASSAHITSRLPPNATPAQVQQMQRLQMMLSTNPAVAEDVRKVISHLPKWSPVVELKEDDEEDSDALHIASDHNSPEANTLDLGVGGDGFSPFGTPASKRRERKRNVGIDIFSPPDEDSGPSVTIHDVSISTAAPQASEGGNGSTASASNNNVSISRLGRSGSIAGALGTVRSAAVDKGANDKETIQQLMEAFVPPVTVNAIPIELPTYISPFDSNPAQTVALQQQQQNNNNNGGNGSVLLSNVMNSANAQSNAGSFASPTSANITTTANNNTNNGGPASPMVGARGGAGRRGTASSSPQQGGGGGGDKKSANAAAGDGPIVITAADINTSTGVLAAPICPVLTTKLFLSSAIHQPCGPLVLTGGMPVLTPTVNVSSAEVGRQIDAIHATIAQEEKLQEQLALLTSQQQQSSINTGDGAGGGGASFNSSSISNSRGGSIMAANGGGGGDGGNGSEGGNNTGRQHQQQRGGGVLSSSATLLGGGPASGSTAPTTPAPERSEKTSLSTSANAHATLYPPFLPLPPSAGSTVYITHIDHKPIAHWLKLCHVEHIQHLKHQQYVANRQKQHGADENGLARTNSTIVRSPSINLNNSNNGNNTENKKAAASTSRNNSTTSPSLSASAAGRRPSGSVRKGSIAAAGASTNSVANAVGGNNNNSSSGSGAAAGLPTAPTINPASLPPPTTFEELLKHIEVRFAIGSKVTVRVVATPGSTYHAFATGGGNSIGERGNLTQMAAGVMVNTMQGGGGAAATSSPLNIVCADEFVKSATSQPPATSGGAFGGEGGLASNNMSYVSSGNNLTEMGTVNTAMATITGHIPLGIGGVGGGIGIGGRNTMLNNNGNAIMTSLGITGSPSLTSPEMNSPENNNNNSGVLAPHQQQQPQQQQVNNPLRVQSKSTLLSNSVANPAKGAGRITGAGLHSVVYFPSAISFDLVMVVGSTETASTEEYERLKFLVTMDASQYCKPTMAQLAEIQGAAAAAAKLAGGGGRGGTSSPLNAKKKQ